MRKYLPKPLKYPLIALYILTRLILRGIPRREVALNLAGVLPRQASVVHGGKVKLLALREKFGETWRRFNISYFASSGLPFAPSLWIKMYKFFGVKVVWNQNGVAYDALYPREVLERVNSILKPIHLSDFVVYQTEFTKKCSDKYLGEFKGPSTILINPVDVQEFTPRGTPLPAEPLRILMSGHHFESPERLRVSLEAVRELIRRGVGAKLLVVGNTQDLPQEEWLEAVGKFSRADAPRLYHKAHMLLHLKNLDPCPNFVLEALASGLPVVGLGNGGMPELVDKQSGVLVPCPENFNKFQYPSAQEVAEAIMKVRDNLEEFSFHARKQALKFDKEIWLEKHEEIFARMLP